MSDKPTDKKQNTPFNWYADDNFLDMTKISTSPQDAFGGIYLKTIRADAKLIVKCGKAGLHPFDVGLWWLRTYHLYTRELALTDEMIDEYIEAHGINASGDDE